MDIQVPEKFEHKIKGVFGNKGSRWLDKLPDIYNKCIERWELTDCNIHNELSFNLICFGKSSRFGKVVLKIGVPHAELYTEMEALKIYSGRNICTCYDTDVNLGALLLERIESGIDLTHIKSIDERIEVAADLIQKLPQQVEGIYDLPTYNDWIKKAFNRLRNDNIAGPRMISLVNTTEALYRTIVDKENKRVLLHGDLHHQNILQDERGQWKAIDPKGVIGIPSMEPARFIQNQLRMDTQTDLVKSLDKMTTVFSNKLGETRRKIAICSLADYVLSTCWGFEGDFEEDQLMRSINHCVILDDYIKKL